MSTGAMILRRRRGSNWRRFDDLGTGPLSPAGRHVARLIDAEDRAAEWSATDRPLDRRLVPAPGHRVERTLRYNPPEYAVERTTVVLEDGLPLRYDLDDFAADLLLRIDGRATIADLIGDGASVTAIASLRDLIRFGVVEPAWGLTRP